MIREVTLRRFKRFNDQTFRLDGHVVLAGPNNSGKTTLLQAIAVWQLAWTRWTEAGRAERQDDAYAWVPIARQAFFAVPVLTFHALWHGQNPTHSIEIEVASQDGWRIAMELKAETPDQILVRPASSIEPWVLDLGYLRSNVTFVPSMTGLGLEEPVYQPSKIEQRLGMGRPGEVLRNLLLEAYESPAWKELRNTMLRLFGIDLLPPESRGAQIIASYREHPSGPVHDISSAGSGVHQVLLLLTLLHVRRGSVLLVDEPGAHLHGLLQDAVYRELRSTAAKAQSQLIVATHSEAILNAVEPGDICLLGATPRRLVDAVERIHLVRSLGVLSPADVTIALQARGILYLPSATDLALLQEWARILDQPAYAWLSSQAFWKAHSWQPRPEGAGFSALQHFKALEHVRSDLPGLILLEGDERRFQSSPIGGDGLQRIAWNRYGAESYLIHPAVLERFVRQCAVVRGVAEVNTDSDGSRAAWARLLGSEELAEQFAENPLSPPPLVEAFLTTTRARTDILPALLQATGLHDMESTRFAEIAAVMQPDEIHWEVRQTLDMLAHALRLP
jgi:hypothetical protein